MAELQVKSFGGDGGATPSPKPRFKLTRKNIIVYGGIAIVAFLVIKKLMGNGTTQTTDTAVLQTYGSEYGTNTVDTAAQLQNAQDIMDGTMQSMFNAFASDIQSQINANNADVNSYVAGVATDLSAGVQAALSNQQSAFTDSLNQQTEKFNTLAQTNAESMAAFNEQIAQIKNATVQTPTTGVVQPKPATVPQKVTNLSSISNPVTKEQQTRNEVIRKAQAGIKLVAPTKEKQELYNAVKNKAEIERKAKAGIALKNPTKEAQAYYNSVKASVK